MSIIIPLNELMNALRLMCAYFVCLGILFVCVRARLFVCECVFMHALYSVLVKYWFISYFEIHNNYMQAVVEFCHNRTSRLLK